MNVMTRRLLSSQQMTEALLVRPGADSTPTPCGFFFSFFFPSSFFLSFLGFTYFRSCNLDVT